MHTVDFNAGVEGKPKAAFVIMYALDGRPWHGYGKPDRDHLTIPTCIMINRSDGDIGFVGGKVEAGESLEEAAIREVKEEIGHSLSLHLEPLVAHDIGTITSHAFTAEMSYLQLRNIQKEVVNADHFGSEITGLFLPHLIDYPKNGLRGGIVNLYKSSMALSVREELTHLLLKKELFTKHELDAICTASGHSLEELLK